MFFHLFSAASPSQSQTTTSRLSSSHSLATMLEPMNPAPPVTRMTRLDMEWLMPQGMPMKPSPGG
jgi:hypothetical protein